MKKNNTANKAALDAKQISEALKKSTQNVLQDMLNEAISKTLMESEDDDKDEETEVEQNIDVDNVEDDEDDSYNVEDVDTEESSEECEDGECESSDNDEEETPSNDEEDSDDWSDMEDYKVGDNDYDFTGLDGDEVLKVYNKLGDDDQIFVKKDEDGNYELKDEETGAEYVIELNGDAEQSDDEEIEFEIGDDNDDSEEDDAELDITFDDNDEDSDDEEDAIDIEFNDEDDDEEETLNEENLGYTDSYQKDVMPNLNMNEPANKQATNDWDAGAPKGNEKPFSKKENKESNLFTQPVNEEEVPTAGEEPTLEEETVRKSKQTKRVTNSEENSPREHKKEYASPVNENMKKIIAAAKQIQAENKQYKKAIGDIKKSLYEAAVLNVTLGQVVKLLSENTTTKQEKQSIVERFNNVKTIQESKMLYETVSKELNESKKSSITLDKGFSTTSKEALNETTLYQNNPAMNMMNRMDSLENMWKGK